MRIFFAIVLNLFLLFTLSCTDKKPSPAPKGKTPTSDGTGAPNNSTPPASTNGDVSKDNLSSVLPLALINLSNGSGSCTGSFIADDFIITAGHCFDDHNGLAVTANAVEVFHNDKSKTRLAAADIHSSGALFPAETFYKDIGFVRLNKAATKIATPLAVVKSRHKIADTAPLKFFGFASNTIHEMKIEDWVPAAANLPGITEAQFTTWTTVARITGEGTAAAADSGGPMFYFDGTRFVLVGVLQGDVFRDAANTKRLTFTPIEAALTTVSALMPTKPTVIEL